MKVTLLTVVALTTVALCSAADPECKRRKSNKLPMHWANSTDCGRFYRCTNKNAKREVVCAKNKVYHPKLGKCVKNEPGLCNITQIAPIAAGDEECAGENAGTFVPMAGYCRQYYICTGSSALLQVCSPGSYFDEIERNCQPDTDSICWENMCLDKPDDTYIPDETNCRLYYTCANSEASKEECVAGTYFDATENSCQPDPNGEHCQKNICVGADQGEFKPDPRDCYGFFICNEGEALAQACSAGSYFDAIELTCVPGECSNGGTTESCTQETTTACTGEETTVPTTTPCSEDNDGREIAESAVEIRNCPGGYVEGQFILHPNEMELFYICMDGKLVESSCMKGNYFDAKLGVCAPKKTKKRGSRGKRSVADFALNPAVQDLPTNNLIQNSERLNEPLRTLDDTKQSYWNLEDSAAGFYSGIDKQKQSEVADEINALFELNDLRLLAKQNGLIYEEYIEAEEPAEPEVPQMQPEPTAATTTEAATVAVYVEGMEIDPALVAANCFGIYSEGQLVKHPTHCRKFLICHSGKMKLEDCGIGKYFNETTNSCAEDYFHRCTDDSVMLALAAGANAPAPNPDDADCTCPGGYKQGVKLKHPDDCDKYYTCDGRVLVLTTCPQNQYYDVNVEDCVPDEQNVCWPADICKGQPNDMLIENRNDCTTFYSCNNGKSTLNQCQAGDFFNPSSGKYGSCQQDIHLECLNPCAESTGIVFMEYNYDSCSYILCNAGRPYIEKCPSGAFDTNIGHCNPALECKETLCSGIDDGVTFPIIGDINQFYLCKDGVAITVSCDPGTGFNSNFGVCMPIPNPDCGNKCESSVTGTTFVPEQGKYNSTAFCFCRDGEGFLDYCSEGYYYNILLETCFSNAPCDPDFCDYSAQYSRSVNRANQSSFCMCVSGQQVIVPCPIYGTIYDGELDQCLNVPEQSDQCDPDYCLNPTDGVIFKANDNNEGFCMCEGTTSVFISCGNGKIFDPNRLICVPVNVDTYCSAAECMDNPDKIFAADGLSTSYCYCINETYAVLYACPNNEEFDPVRNVCLVKGCDANVCEAEPNCQFPASNDPYQFCLCLDGVLRKMDCPENYIFDKHHLVCRPDPCDKSYCSNPSNDGVPFEAINYPIGYCTCKKGVATLKDCPEGDLFDPLHGACVQPVLLECNIALCADATLTAPYPIAAKNDPYSFCYCFTPEVVELFPCPAETQYNATSRYCESVYGYFNAQNLPASLPIETPIFGEDNCTCPGGYVAGQLLSVPDDCRKFLLCMNGVFTEYDCGPGNRYDSHLRDCVADPQNTCQSPSACTCVGAYKEGDFLAHPLNSQLYYVCFDGKLYEGDCLDGNIFDQTDSMCKPLSSAGIPSMRSGNAAALPENDAICPEGVKRPVIKNCTQYDVCVSGQWTRRQCPEQRYYNADAQNCEEPLDDTVCALVRVSGLPACNNATMQQRTAPAKGESCAQYYHCSDGKWRLRACPTQHYYSTRWHTCLPATHTDVCHDRNSAESLPLVDDSVAQQKCRHTAVRQYTANCAMYLMCLEGEWWYQYCPLGMYFNRTHNYCLPNDDHQCANANSAFALATHDALINVAGLGDGIAGDEFVAAVDEFTLQPCSVEGALRGSALACERYYVCAARKWHAQSCAAAHYFDADAEACMRDEKGICAQLAHGDCAEGDRREFPLNCTAYELCQRGRWQRVSCTNDTVFDNVLHTCVPNDGSCARNGLRRVCKAGESRPLPLAGNCTEFFYCRQDTWQLGACLKGHTYGHAAASCVPHAPNDKCSALWTDAGAIEPLDGVALPASICEGQVNGVAVPHPQNCRRFFLCIAEEAAMEQECINGSFFDPQLGYCRLNDGSCRTPLTGVCAEATDGERVPYADDCRAYYHCSAVNGSQLIHCPAGEYYDQYTRQCRVDYGECRPQLTGNGTVGKCIGVAHGARLPHDTYCNIYYACVRGLAIPVECPDEYRFSAALGRCIYDVSHDCIDGHMPDNSTVSISCGNHTDGTHLPDRTDCTRYYLCSEGAALPKRCSSGAYFDAEQALCVPDDGSCPFVYDDQPNQPPVPPNSTVCEDKHGYMMPDPANCNEFYVCINSKLRHERCNENHYFNAIIAQCQQRELENGELVNVSAKQKQCTDKPTDFADLCAQIPEGSAIAEQSDCRRYINCANEEPSVQRCRNGESYDSLLGFCRQNDGTCLLENGQRVGDCSGRHGQLVRDNDNCRGYFVCINGQKIAAQCAEHEYFNKTLGMCQQDVNNQCNAGSEEQPDQIKAVTCEGLSEAMLYPYVHDNCRSYFQCIKGVPKVHECADGLYFNATLTRCVKRIRECAMPVINVNRAPEVVYTKREICENVTTGKRYANVDDHCRSYYVCESDGTIAFTTCPANMLFETETGVCEEAANVICRI